MSSSCLIYLRIVFLGDCQTSSPPSCNNYTAATTYFRRHIITLLSTVRHEPGALSNTEDLIHCTTAYRYILVTRSLSRRSSFYIWTGFQTKKQLALGESKHNNFNDGRQQARLQARLAATSKRKVPYTTTLTDARPNHPNQNQHA